MAAATLVTAPVARTRIASSLSSPLRSPLGGQLARFAVIGAGSTALNLGLLAVLHAPLGAQVANLVGLAVSTVANTAANRAWTFRVRGGDGMARQHLQSMLVFALTWGLSSAALAVLTLGWPHASTAVTVAVVAAANAVSTVARFALMRTWIFRVRT